MRMRSNDLIHWSCLTLAAQATLACGSSTGPGAHAVKEIWYQTQAGDSRARPATAGDLVFFGTGDGRVIARNIQTGAATWSTPASSEAIDGANLLVKEGV